MLLSCMPQAKTGAYDLNGNLALLRHYSFAPETAKLDATAAVLTKAMMRLPEPDFAQLLHLIPERVQVWRCLVCSIGVILTPWHLRGVPNTPPTAAALNSRLQTLTLYIICPRSCPVVKD